MTRLAIVSASEPGVLGAGIMSLVDFTGFLLGHILFSF